MDVILFDWHLGYPWSKTADGGWALACRCSALPCSAVLAVRCVLWLHEPALSGTCEQAVAPADTARQ